MVVIARRFLLSSFSIRLDRPSLSEKPFELRAKSQYTHRRSRAERVASLPTAERNLTEI